MSTSPGTTTLAEAELPLFVGVDLGGTNIKLGLVDQRGFTLAFEKIPTRSELGPDDAVERMATTVSALLAAAGAERNLVAGLGMVTPGPLDLESGMLLTPGNLPGWWNYPIRARMAAATRLPVRYANDANAAAFGEYWRGAGVNSRSMILLTLGTGIGGGIVVDGNLIEGTHGCGAECGFILVETCQGARGDSQGTFGTLEAYCGSYGVVGRARDGLSTHPDSSLNQLLSSGAELNPLAIAEAAEQGDSWALEVVLETAHYLALGIVTLIHTIDPDSVVLGGAMTFGGAGHPLGERFLQQIRDEVRPRLLPALRELMKIDFAMLGGDAGYVGAAGLARLAHQQHQVAPD